MIAVTQGAVCPPPASPASPLCLVCAEFMAVTQEVCNLPSYFNAVLFQKLDPDATGGVHQVSTKCTKYRRPGAAQRASCRLLLRPSFVR